MKKNILLCWFFVFSSAAFSQAVSMDYGTAAMTRGDNSIVGMWIPGKSLDTKIEGSVYLFPNSMGQYLVRPKGGNPIKLYNLNYNLKSKALEAQISKDSVFQYNIDQIDYVVHLNKKYKAVEDSQLTGLLLEVFDGSKIKFYKETNIIVQEGTFNPLTQEKMSEDRYLQTHTYYVFVDEKYQKIKLGKKVILKYLSDKENLIKEFVSKNNLTYTSDEDLGKIFNYYNLL